MDRVAVFLDYQNVFASARARFHPAPYGFRLVESRRVVHRTPWGSEQPFTVVVARRDA